MTWGEHTTVERDTPDWQPKFENLLKVISKQVDVYRAGNIDPSDPVGYRIARMYPDLPEDATWTIAVDHPQPFTVLIEMKETAFPLAVRRRLPAAALAKRYDDEDQRVEWFIFACDPDDYLEA